MGISLNQLAPQNVAPVPPASKLIFSFFGLCENPFSTNPNPRFLYRTPLTQSASQHLVDGVRDRKGLILLTGEVGTGKTLLLRRLLDWLAEQKMPIALILNSHIHPDHLLNFILSDFGIHCESSLKSDKLISLNRWLLDRYRFGQTPVLIVDEAQGLPLRTLEEIRLLLNLETSSEKLLQVILAGQPELEEKLKRHELRQFRQRIAVRCGTAPLESQETQAYIHEHLRIAGAERLIFQRQAAISIHAYAKGVPRLVNLLCEYALINAYAGGSRVVTPQFVECAARDCQLDQSEPISGEVNSAESAGAATCDFNSILAVAFRPYAAPPPSMATPTGSCVMAGVLSPGMESEVQVCMMPSGSREATTCADTRPPIPSLHSNFTPDPVEMLPSENSTVTFPALQKTDAAKSRRPSSVNAVQTQALPPTTEVRTLQACTSFSRATMALLRGWRRGFIADAHSTWRQLRGWLRARAVKVKPYEREFVHPQS